MKYSLKPKGKSRFIEIEAIAEAKGRTRVEIQLSAWRPGRYELGNFAKNVRGFQVKDAAGNALSFEKINKDRWLIQNPNKSDLHISYEYYGATLDAGSTFNGLDIFYVNPVNCLVFDPENMNDACELELNLPKDYEVGGSMKREGNTLFAANTEELLDSPILASPQLEHHYFEVEGKYFHIWIKGEHTLDVAAFIEKAKLYTLEQFKVFGEFDSQDFHYLFIFLPTKVRHGVEHSRSTVIISGPGEEMEKTEKLNDLLAISSHELFHFWNVKRIRPSDMWPYDYTKENYSKLGYVYEGITTYYGDYMLLRSGAFDFDEYSKELSSDVQRHYENEGRYSYSVAESSFDTWLDGYTPGVPGRKVSIYVEGMLAALMLDMEIRYATNNSKCLDDVMRSLYDEFYKKGKGFTEADYKRLAEEAAGKSFDFFFDDFYNGRGQVEKFLPDTLWSIGCEIAASPSELKHESDFGFKIIQANKPTVGMVLNDSPADEAGLCIGDEILLVNNIQVDHGAEWNDVFTDETELEVWNNLEGKKNIVLKPSEKPFYQKYKVQKMAGANEQQKAFFKAWSGQEFGE